MKIFFCASISFIIFSVFSNIQASIVAIVDTGVDINHVDIASSVWTNPLDLSGNTKDEDRNGYLNDVNGWNFVEDNGVLIDSKYTKYLTPEVRRFFDIQSAVANGNINRQDILWAKNQLRDRAFLRMVSTYSSFMHGTHVGGIAIKGTRDSQLLTVKLATAGTPSSQNASEREVRQEEMFWGSEGISGILSSMVDSQMEVLSEIAEYLNGHNTDVANFSFGLSYQYAKEIVDESGGWVFSRSDDKEVERLTRNFLKELLVKGRKMVQKFPDMLFVIAAGNEGTDNDTLWAFPANINAENTITVAATFEDGTLASFSNYGGRTVEIAAPGVAIESTAPGDEYLSVSGTSQAAPFVTRAASMVKDANLALTPGEIKKILMRTVTKKSFLKGDVVSGGVLNQERAVYAAELSNIMGLDDAIEHSLTEVSDPLVQKSGQSPFLEELKNLVLPLPSIFVRGK